MINPHKVMEEAAQLALLGKGDNKTNPIVGACVVKDSKIVSRGYHTGFGNPHAEVEAIDNSPVNVQGADLYVTLEPCSHFGKTPPCTKKIIESGIKRVFVGVVDPNPVNAGNGINELLKNGIEVYIGFAEKICSSLIEDFAKTIYKKEPYYTLKVAQSIDGKIALENGHSKWITNKSSRTYAHYLRSISDAVLVGIDTVLKDDPELNVRLIKSYREPFKVVLDTDLRISPEFKLVKNFAEYLIVFTSGENEDSDKWKMLKDIGVTLIPCKRGDFGLDLDFISKELLKMNIMNVLVEGGSRIFGSFLKMKKVDKLNIFIAPKILGDGVASFGGIKFNSIDECIKFYDYEYKFIEKDLLISASLTDYKKYVLELTEKVRNRCLQGL